MIQFTLMRHIRSCGCILVTDSKVLLISSYNDIGGIFWSFPKGQQEKNETDFETAIRETKEETGLNVKIIDNHPIKVGHFIEHKTVYKEIVFYLSEVTGRYLKRQEDEIKEAKWISISKAERYLKDYYLVAWHEAMSRLTKHFRK